MRDRLSSGGLIRLALSRATSESTRRVYHASGMRLQAPSGLPGCVPGHASRAPLAAWYAWHGEAGIVSSKAAASSPSRWTITSSREPLGSGATARVFEAVHTAHGPGGRHQAARRRLPRLARAAGAHGARGGRARQRARARHVSRLLGYGWESEQPFLVLERLDGETLADVLRREARLPAPRGWSTGSSSSSSASRDCHRRERHPPRHQAREHLPRAARRASGEPVVKLIDFGVARLNEIASAGASLTSTHHLIGSMGYMAPEQLEYAKGVGPDGRPLRRRGRHLPVRHRAAAVRRAELRGR